MSGRLRNLLVLALTAAGALLLISSQAPAFQQGARNQILKDAMLFCPERLREYLKRHEEVVIDASQLTDKMKPFELERYNLPRSADLVYGALVSGLKKGRLEDSSVARRFGLLANLVAEAHYLGRRKIVSIAGVHLPEKVYYKGYERIEDPRGMLESIVNKYMPFRRDERVKVFDYLYIQSVSRVADYWRSAWENSGLAPGREPRARVIVHK